MRKSVVRFWIALGIVVLVVGAASAQTPFHGSATVQVPVDQSWFDTGIGLTAGQKVVIRAYGTAAGSSIVPGVPQWFGPEGVGDNCTDPNKPFPGAFDLLIGRIGESGPSFAVGDFRGFIADSAGELYLGINDGLPGDNTGFFVAVVYLLDGASAAVSGDSASRGSPGLAAFPNPGGDGVTLSLPQGSGSLADLSIYDVHGGLVRNLAGALSTGLTQLRWDGRNEQDRRVGGGIYFVRGRTVDGRTVSTQVTVIH